MSKTMERFRLLLFAVGRIGVPTVESTRESSSIPSRQTSNPISISVCESVAIEYRAHTPVCARTR